MGSLRQPVVVVECDPRGEEAKHLADHRHFHSMIKMHGKDRLWSCDTFLSWPEYLWTQIAVVVVLEGWCPRRRVITTYSKEWPVFVLRREEMRWHLNYSGMKKRLTLNGQIRSRLMLDRSRSGRLLQSIEIAVWLLQDAKNIQTDRCGQGSHGRAMMKFLFDVCFIFGHDRRSLFDHTQQIEWHRCRCCFAFLLSHHGFVFMSDTRRLLLSFGDWGHFELIDDLWISTAKEIGWFQSNEFLFIIIVVFG